MWATEAQAAQRAKAGSGQHVAQVVISEHASHGDIVIRRTSTREGHFDVWGRPQAIGWPGQIGIDASGGVDRR